MSDVTRDDIEVLKYDAKIARSFCEDARSERLLRIASLIERLPMTADGVVVHPDDDVWVLVDGDIEVDCAGNVTESGYSYYSTEEAAAHAPSASETPAQDSPAPS